MTLADSTLGGRYRLISPIAAGGMGEVWRAVDELLGREVAVKLLGSHVAADPSFRERFRAEARITAALTDPGIAQVFDYGESDDGAYLVMELVPGEPLSAILARNGALACDIVLDLIQQAAKGLWAAHRAGVIHRDVKPGNLLITADGQVKITDFGIARAREAAPLTRTGTVLGTVQYVSPEQASGSTLTPATDVYSLGVVAYECLTGRPPFTGETPVTLALKHINEPPPALPRHVPAPVRDLVFAMLAKSPADRPASGPELVNRVAALRESLAEAGTAPLGALTDPRGFPARTTPGTAAARASGPGTRAMAAPAPGRAAGGGNAGRNRRRPPAMLLVGTGCAVAVAAGVLAFSTTRSTEPPEAPATPGHPAVSVSPSARPQRSVTPRTHHPMTSATSAKPTAVSSATVSTSAPSTQEPSPAPSPTPTSAPTPTPTLTPSETPVPSDTPTDTSPEDEVDLLGMGLMMDTGGTPR